MNAAQRALASGAIAGGAARPPVAALLVTFRPDLDRLEAALTAVMPQVDRLIVVDNSETSEERDAIVARLPEGCEYIALGDNLGIAAAYNRGCALVDRGAAGTPDPGTSVLLLDQDSVASSGMVTALAQALAQPGVAACGPVYLDAVTGRGPVVLRAGLFGWRRSAVGRAQGAPVNTESLISSGSLISAAARRELGGFDERLFIDHVDTDWCLRARRHGYRLLLVPDAGMRHRLGDEPQRLPWRRDRAVPRHAARRLYFIVRNGLWLMRGAAATWAWRCSELRRLAAFAVLAALDAERAPRLRSWLRGVRDGLGGHPAIAPAPASDASLVRGTR
ncbi:MAG: glycosyltransferase family 2 protein [Pseudomonadota bacterium]